MKTKSTLKEKEFAMDIAMTHFNLFERFLKWRASFNIAWSKWKEMIMGTDRIDIPEKKLLEYIYDAIPGLKDADIPDVRAWYCPAQDLPIPSFEKGDIVVWNDKFIAKTHGARTENGEGPFTVRIVDDFILGFNINEHGNTETILPRIDRITLETPTGRLIIAHPGYFKHKEG